MQRLWDGAALGRSTHPVPPPWAGPSPRSKISIHVGGPGKDVRNQHCGAHGAHGGFGRGISEKTIPSIRVSGLLPGGPTATRAGCPAGE